MLAEPLADAVDRAFAPDGALARGWRGFVERPGQRKLALEIAETFEHQDALMSEAETGTGKTLAYLVPALFSDQRVLISTHTRALQDQLVFRDLPLVQRALKRRRSVALLKGRQNYLCPERLDRVLRQGRVRATELDLFHRLREWGEESADGDLAGFEVDVAAAGILGRITATSEQCLGSRCDFFDACPLMRARRRAMEADIVVTNHSLLLADCALKSNEHGRVLPEFDAFVLDEAHALADLAGQQFGLQLTVNRFAQWFNDMQMLLEDFGDEPDLKRGFQELAGPVLDAWKQGDTGKVSELWSEVAALAETRAMRSEEARRLHERAERIQDELAMVLSPPEGFVSWPEGEGKDRKWSLAPVQVGPVLAERLWSKEAAFVLLSATLRISGTFDYARARLGLDAARTSHHASPFDYGRQALIYIPERMPEPREPGYPDRLEREIRGLLAASRGRAFVLFSSWKMLDRIAPRLAGDLPWPVLIQGRSGSRDALLDRFRGDTHSVLCGTRSFWEGVDVPGEALSLVVIDKLPFAPPDDPLFEARLRHCEQSGGNKFRDIQLPEAIAVLRQGAGRLIRTEQDRGVIAILDGRLRTRPYGREVVSNLPPARITADLEDVRAFFRE